MKRLLFFVFYCLLCVTLSAQTIKPLFKCSGKLHDQYGVCSHFTFTWDRGDYITFREQARILSSLGCNTVRFDITYNTISENNKATLDTILPVLKQMKLSPLTVLPDRRLKANSWNEKDNYFERQLETLKNHYLSNLKYIEFQNEVNFSKLLNIGLHYTNDLHKVYDLKRKNKKLKILFSGITDSHFSILDSIMSCQAFKYFDVMNFHTYRKPEDIPLVMNIIHDNMVKYGWTKPIWMTECGMPTAVKKGQDDEERKQLEDEQAKRVARIHLIAFAYGIDKVFWYEFRSMEDDPYYSEDNFGMVHKDLNPKPAYYAYNTLIKMLPNGSTRPVLTIKDGIYKAEWKRPDGKKINAYWCKEGATYIKLNVKPTMIVDYMGKKLTVKENKVRVSSGVVYLIK